MGDQCASVGLESGPVERTSYDEYGAADALEAEAAPVLDGLSADTAGHDAPMDFDEPSVPVDTLAELYGVIADRSPHPIPDALRTMPEQGSAASPVMAKEAVGSGPAPDEEGLVSAAEAPAAPFDYDSAYQWATRMFAVGTDAPIGLGGDAILPDATVGVCCTVKQVVQAFFRDRLDDIGRSPERPDLRLTQEEAQGHLVGNLVIGELLAHEGRAVGKRVDNVVAKEARDAAAAKEKAKGPRKAARALADPAAREAALKAVDDDLAAQLARRLRALPSISLQLPARQTAVVESKLKVLKPEAAEAKAVDKLARLRAAAARAEAAVLPAEALLTAAKRRVERAQKAWEDLTLLRFHHALAGAKVPLPEKSGQPDEAYEAHRQQQEELDSEKEALNTRLSRLRSERTVAQEAADDARDAAELARDAVAAEERARADARRRAERDAEWAALMEEHERERAEGEVRMAESRARVDASMAALARLKRERSPSCMPTVTAPKVFKLTGMSAADVSSMASHVSQESSGPLFWDESAWEGYNRAVEREYGSH